MMFRTVKSKILVLAFLMLVVLVAVFIFNIGTFKLKTKQLMLQNYSYSINSFVQEINEKVIRLEDNSRDLALLGALFYKIDRDIPITNKAIIKIFENYENSLGGGIWFEPYIVFKNQKRLCFYAYRNKNNKLVLDDEFASEEYDYHNQGWYKQITAQISKEHNTAWSMPYYENQGSRTMMITVGTGIYDGDKLVGISTVDWELNSIFEEIKEMKPIERGFAFYENKGKIKDSFSLFASEQYNYIIASDDPYLDNESLVGKTLDNIPWYNKNLNKITYFNYHNKIYVPFVKRINNGMMLIICIPKEEMFKDISRHMSNILVTLIMLGVLISAALYAILNNQLINPIYKLMDIAKKIGKGEDVKIKIEKPEEFAQLASAFDKMTSDIKSITKEQAKINSELAIAKTIQTSSLPSIFPPFPERNEFDIYASMDAAKEVGGDFYDFYFTDNNDNFMFLIADVSGKGIPAALFMMTAKTLINNMAQVGYQPKELIEIVNTKICENNTQGFFITMLTGIINIKSGEMSIINCGHNKPLIKHENGSFEYLDIEANFPLGIFENSEFDVYKTKLQKGDIIFTYTDGITEAINNKEEMYGEERLLNTLNSIENPNNSKNIINFVKQNIKMFTEETLQSDDITMLCFNYNEVQPDNKKEYSTDAEIQNYKAFYNWVHSVLEDWNINKELFNKIDMSAEEIFANITFYAYPDKKGKIKTSIEKNDNEIIIIFEDSGIPYNPLEKPDPDIDLPPEERPLGGLGIFMVKKMAQKIAYENKDGKNILTIIFSLL